MPISATGSHSGSWTEPPGESLVDNVSFCFRVLHENYNDCLRRHLRRRGLDRVIRPGFGFVLFTLFEKGTACPSDICRQMGIKPSTLTALTDRMVAADLIERRPCDSDRRAVALHLTEAGEALREDCYELIQEMTGVICQGISPRSLANAMKVMRQMIHNMASVQPQ